VVQAALPQLHSGENILRGNAVINQVAALAGLAAPFLGSLLYAALGLGPVLLGAGLCFLLTALLERFIRLAKLPGRAREGGLLGTLYGDLAESLHFLRREERDVLRLLLLAALVSFFAAGAALVGFPYLVREVLGLTAELYGAAESALGAAALLGALAAGVFGPRLRRRQLLISAFGLSLLPAGAAFLLPLGAIARYLVLTAAFFAGQLCCSLYSVLAVSMIQQRTPEQLTGKVMALTSTIAMCAQPLGQLAYGALFDLVGNEAELILLPTGLALLLLGLRPCFTNPGRVLK
jgi:Na+/melibiose symporter-like transporter